MKIKEFFYFNRSDRQAILFLLALAVAAITAFFLFDDKTVTTENGYRSQPQKDRVDGKTSRPLYYKVEERTPELFTFDPNTADSTALLSLGLRPWQVRNIYKYRSKGGVYRCPADFARLYGLTQKQYLALKPYIRIGKAYQPAALLPEAQERKARHDSLVAHYTPKLKAGEHIELNAADTSLLQHVPGIGPYYARQIVRYRDRLGGFVNPAQLLEIDGFPATSLNYFSVNAALVSRLNVNQLTLSQLRHHPYIDFYMARDIVDYRRLRGPLKRLDDLRLLKSFPPEALERLRPYITF